MDIPIIYENDEIIIINKPAGLAVQGGEKITHSLDKDFSQQLGYKIYLVHRLDKDTSGLMIVAKNPLAASMWTKLIGSKNVKKEYIAICSGCLKQKKGVIDEDLIQHGAVRKAVTNYAVEEEWEKVFEDQTYRFCKIRLKLETGRMHQIRIHLAKNGCPICGDDQHGDFKLNKQLKKAFKIKQLLLTSQKLEIPLEGQTKVFEIELPEHMINQLS